MGCRRGWATSELTVGCQSNWSLNLVKPWVLPTFPFVKKGLLSDTFKRIDGSFTSFHLPKINTDHHGPSRKKTESFQLGRGSWCLIFWTPQMDRVYIKGLRFGPPELPDTAGCFMWIHGGDMKWEKHLCSNGKCLDLLLTKYITPSCNLKKIQIQTHH